MTSTTRTTSTADGVTIAYERTGSGDGPVLVLVHGITDSRRDWDEVVERLAPGHDCVTLDLRGHGESGDAGDYGALAMAGDLAAVVAAEGLDRPVVIGHSLGGVVVTAYAAQASVAAVVNVDQPLKFSDFAAGLVPLGPALRGDGFHEALAAIFDAMTGPMLTDEQRARLAPHRANARQDVVMGVWDLVLSTPPDQLDAIADAIGPAVTAPYLSLHGLDPGEGYAAWLTARIPQAQVEQWPDHGHYPHWVDPDRFAERVEAMVADAT